MFVLVIDMVVINMVMTDWTVPTLPHRKGGKLPCKAV